MMQLLEPYGESVDNPSMPSHGRAGDGRAPVLLGREDDSTHGFVEDATCWAAARSPRKPSPRSPLGEALAEISSRLGLTLASLLHPARRVYMGVSENKGYSTLNSRILRIRTPK